MTTLATIPAAPASASILTARHPEIHVPFDRRALRGAKVLFVNMPLREHAVPNCIPLGPALMAARLREYDADVRIVDLNAFRPHRTPEQIRAILEGDIARHGSPDVVGLSGLITTLRWQEITARLVRELAPDAYLVSGGGLATDLPERLLEWIPELDGVATGEGDDVVFKVALDGLAARERGLRGSGARARRLHDPSGVYRGARPRDLDALPLPAWDLVDLDVYLAHPIWGGAAHNSSATPFSMTRSMNTVSSRGCPFACTYCDRTATGGRTYGVRTAENLAAEAALLMDRYGIDFLGITDDNAMVVRDRLRDMVPAFRPLVARGLRWGTHGRMDEAGDVRPDGRIEDPPRVKWMAEAGCVYIGFGAESAHPDVLTAMGKGGHILAGGMETYKGDAFPRTMIQALRHCKEYGIHPNCTWIMGYPGETLDRLQHTVRFIAMMEETGLVPGGANNHNMFVATAYPGTEMFRHPVVRRKIHEAFGDDFRRYVLELDDATKVVENNGVIMNYSAMDDATFRQARACVEEGRVFDILSL